MYRYIKQLYSISPGYFILLLNIFFILISFPFNYPLIFFLIIAIGFNLLFQIEERALFSCFSIPFIVGILAFISHLLARINLHGYLTARILLLILLICSVIFIIRGKVKIKDLITFISQSQSNSNILPNIALMFFVAAFWIFSIKFWYVSWDNSPHAHYIQMAQHMLERGYFSFLTPEQDVPINGNWWYPNLNAHMIAVFGSFLKGQDLIRFSASLGSFITLWGMGSIYFLFRKTEKSTFTAVTTIILALFCSYSFFKIGPELSSDTPIFIFLPAFYYFLSNGILTKKPNHLYLAAAIAVFSFWYRFNSAVTMLVSILILSLLDLSIMKCLIGFLKKRIFLKVGLIIITAFIGALWTVEVYRLTGNPLHPHGYGSIFKSNRYSITYDSVYLGKDPFQGGDETYAPHLTCKIFNHKGYLQILYHLFALSERTVKEHDLYRIMRGVLVGFTYSTFLTIFALIGIVLSMREKFPVLEKISMSLFISTSLVIILGGLHYKFLYILFLPVLIFSLNTFYLFEKKIPRFSTMTLICYLIVFIISFLMMGMGLERNNWAVAKCLISKPTQNCYVKDYYHYSVAHAIKPFLSPEDKVLNFQPEPGFSLNFHLGMRYYIEEATYQSMDTKELHRAKNEDEALQWLRKNHIKMISFTEPPLRYYLENKTDTSPEILPKMLVERSEKFYYVGPSFVVVDIDPVLLKKDPILNY